MARLVDKKSKRQRGFKMLDTMYRAKPAKRLASLMKRLDVDRPYAETIIATHRREGLKTGKYVMVYAIMDKLRGKSVKPYVSKHPIIKEAIADTDCLTVASAKRAYVANQQQKIKSAKELKIS